MNEISELKNCEVCENKKLHPVLDLGLHPLCDDLVPVGDSRICHEYPIEILFCSQCATAHQRFQVPKKELFPTTYHYRSRFTQDVLNGMSALVNSCEQKLTTLAGKKVVDIGCNDGSLLNFFYSKGCTTIGIEPTDAIKDASKNHKLYNDFFSIDTAEKIVKLHGRPDIITFTNVFAHIENLTDVLNSLKLLMSPTTLLVIENHYLGSILDKKQFDTFYHEHPRTYSYTSFVEIAKKLNTSIYDVEFTSRYGGNIRVFLSNMKGTHSTKDLIKIAEEEQTYLAKFVSLRNSLDKWMKVKKDFIDQFAKANQKIPAKAFPGRAAILVKMLGVNENIISEVFEKPGSMKIGHYLPGTRIVIKSDNELFLAKEKPEFILNLAWHIPAEIKTYLKENGINSQVVDILSDSDF